MQFSDRNFGAITLHTPKNTSLTRHIIIIYIIYIECKCLIVFIWWKFCFLNYFSTVGVLHLEGGKGRGANSLFYYITFYFLFSASKLFLWNLKVSYVNITLFFKQKKSNKKKEINFQANVCRVLLKYILSSKFLRLFHYINFAKIFNDYKI